MNDIYGVLRAIEFYARELLLEHQQYHSKQNVELQQIHAVFDLGIFLGSMMYPDDYISYYHLFQVILFIMLLIIVISMKYL